MAPWPPQKAARSNPRRRHPRSHRAQRPPHQSDRPQPATRAHQQGIKGVTCARIYVPIPRRRLASRSLATALLEGALASGLPPHTPAQMTGSCLIRRSGHSQHAAPIDQPDTECHKSSASEARDPGGIISEPRATSSRNAWAASSESAGRGLGISTDCSSRSDDTGPRGVRV